MPMTTNIARRHCVATIMLLGLTQQALAVEPSSIEATGIINDELGFDASNWDTAPASMMNKGRNFNGEEMVSESFFDDLVTPNKMLKDAFAAQYKALISPTGNYRSQFWVLNAEKKQFMMVGVYGQLAYFDYENDFAMVTFGSYPIAKDALLVQSLGILIEAMLSAASPGQNLTPPNIEIIKSIGR